MQIPNIRFTEVISILDELNYADKVTSSLCLDAREVLRSNKDLVFSHHLFYASYVLAARGTLEGLQHFQYLAQSARSKFGKWWRTRMFKKVIQIFTDAFKVKYILIILINLPPQLDQKFKFCPFAPSAIQQHMLFLMLRS